ncbi:hypothetical protein ACIGXI_26385 [Kitasatospora aureofaciens]|uniref:hypothetical protein n=1 Tax=Kitasatospora aureofaciens TaxID=1894 RepID=UPI0037CA6656
MPSTSPVFASPAWSEDIIPPLSSPQAPRRRKHRPRFRPRNPTAARSDRHPFFYVLVPLHRHPGVERFPAAPQRAASQEQVAADAIANAAARAAAGAIHLDFGSGALTKPHNWVGAADGSAACGLRPTAHLLYNPSGSDAGIGEYKGRPRY